MFHRWSCSAVRAVVALVALLLCCVTLPTRAHGQGTVEVEVVLPASVYITRDAPRVRVQNILAASEDETRIRNGFPARLRFTTELWPSSGITGNPLSRAEWEVIMDFEPLEKVFRIVRYSRQEGFQSLGQHVSFQDARNVLARSYQPRIRPPQDPGRYFYTAVVEVERMTANDLAELRNWLGSTARSDQNIGTTVARFVGSLFTRMVGAQKRRYQGRSEVFEVSDLLQ